MMHKTKSAKFSLAIKIASILTCVSVMAVGFASWLILKPATDATDVGSFTVYTVDESQLSFAISEADGTVIFGKPATTNNTKWLKPSTAVATEDLSAGFTLTISATNDVKLQEFADYAYVKFAPKSGTLTAFETALTNETITFEATGSATDITINAAAYDASKDYAVLAIPLSSVATTSLTVTVNFNFGWGAHFTPAGENQVPVNPYTYYNGLNNGVYTEANAEDADTYLTYIAALAGGGYDVTVTLTNPAN